MRPYNLDSDEYKLSDRLPDGYVRSSPTLYQSYIIQQYYSQFDTVFKKIWMILMIPNHN